MRFLIKNNPETVKIIKIGSNGALYLVVPKDKTGKSIGIKKINNNKNSYILLFKLQKYNNPSICIILDKNKKSCATNQIIINFSSLKILFIIDLVFIKIFPLNSVKCKDFISSLSKTS